MEKEIKTPPRDEIPSAVNIMLVNNVLYKIGKPITNTELSKELGWIPSQTTSVIKAMLNYRLVTLEKGMSFDQREVMIKLTEPHGRAQAWFDRMKLKSIVGRDRLDEFIIKFGEFVEKKFFGKESSAIEAENIIDEMSTEEMTFIGFSRRLLENATEEWDSLKIHTKFIKEIFERIRGKLHGQ